MGDSDGKELLRGETRALPTAGVIDLAASIGIDRRKPVEFEIGFGKGLFLLDRAQQLPEVVFFGIELKRKWVDLVAARAKKRNLENLYVRHGDAKDVLKRLFPDALFTRIFIIFPDPWWKARHQKRMLVTAPLVQEVARLLADDGELFIETDVESRAEAYHATVSACPDFGTDRPGGGRLRENPFGARSLREKKCEDLGLPVYRMLFHRIRRS